MAISFLLEFLWSALIDPKQQSVWRKLPIRQRLVHRCEKRCAFRWLIIDEHFAVRVFKVYLLADSAIFVTIFLFTSYLFCSGRKNFRKTHRRTCRTQSFLFRYGCHNCQRIGRWSFWYPLVQREHIYTHT